MDLLLCSIHGCHVLSIVGYRKTKCCVFKDEGKTVTSTMAANFDWLIYIVVYCEGL